MKSNHDKPNELALRLTRSVTIVEGGGYASYQHHGYWLGLKKLLLVLAMLLMPAICAEPAWSITVITTDLGTLGGAYSFANAINNKGQVVGFSATDSGETHGFIWEAAVGMIDLGNNINPVHINSAGQVVGNFETPSGQHAFLWQADVGMTELGSLGGTNTFPGDINEVGQVVGTGDTASGEGHAFFWQAGVGMIDLGTLGGPNSGTGRINNAGQIIGMSDTSTGESHPVLWRVAKSGKKTVTTTDLAPFGLAEALAMNEVGQVVGFGPDHIALLWQNGFGTTSLGALGSSSHATNINNNGQILGYGNTAEVLSATILWQTSKKKIAPPTITDLGTLGGNYTFPMGINDAGQVVGFSGDNGFFWQAGVGMIALGTLWSPELRINQVGQVIGTMFTDHGIRAVLWTILP